jgi:MoaA/NifB/PqqE/SkfB family radical SAM enzyme
MASVDWRTVIDDAIRLKVKMVQFIGGEPTTHPEFAELVSYALSVGLAVEVFTNLLHIRPTWWDLFASSNVSLATSYYSDHVDEHEAITQRPGSYAKTRANIAEVVRRGIPLRVGIINMDDGQRVEQARTELMALGVTNIGTDKLRQVGRGVRDAAAGLSQLCGNCARGVAAVSSDGDVWPCVFARWMPIGNVHRAPLAAILNGTGMGEARTQLAEQFGATKGCWPETCNPQCSPSCSPSCIPMNNCRPSGSCSPNWWGR